MALLRSPWEERVIEIINLLGWTYDGDDGEFVVVATFATSAELPEPRVRAHEVMARMSMEEKYQTMSLEEVEINPTDKELGLTPKLSDIGQIDFVRSAYMQIQQEYQMHVPLWVNSTWLLHELRANYSEEGFNLLGRQIKHVLKADEVRSGVLISTEDDAGFIETP